MRTAEPWVPPWLNFEFHSTGLPSKTCSLQSLGRDSEHSGYFGNHTRGNLVAFFRAGAARLWAPQR